jgi:predicted GTPase
MKRILIPGAAGRDFPNSEVISRDNPAYTVEEPTKPGLAELLAGFTHEHMSVLAGVGK